MATLRFTEGASRPPVSVPVPGQLLPNVVDGLAETLPETLYAIIPNSFTTYDAGFRKISYRQFASAVNGAARFLSKELLSTNTSQVLAYIGPNDIGYVVFLLGAVKAGHKLLLLSPRNTKADVASLFKTTGCVTLLTLPPPYSPSVNNVLEALDTKPHTIHVPTIFQLLEKQHPHFPYPKTFAAAKDETLVIVHTSGTTSTPKVVTYTHAFAAAYNRWTLEPPPEGFDNLVTFFQPNRAFTTFPFFHAGGIIVALLNTVMTHTTLVTGLAAVPPSAQGVVDALKHVDVEALHLVAPFLEQMAKNSEMLDFILPRVRMCTFGGADVSEAAANAFLAKVPVAGFNGSTESAPYPLLRPRENWDSADLKYIQPHPIANLQFRPTGMADLCECFVVRNEDPDRKQPVFHLFPDLNEYRTKDLFSPHPTKAGLWLYRGRADDMIVSASGEMCNPVPFEQKLALLPQVADVLMLGTGRYQKALLIEPAKADVSPTDFLDSIWSTVEACNQDYPQVCHIDREHVLVTTPDMPFRRAGKGSVQRAPTLEMYKGHIDRLYETAGDGVGGNVEPYRVHVSAGDLGGSR